MSANRSPPTRIRLARLPRPAELSSAFEGLDRPLVVDGVVERWPIWNRWSFDWFRARYGAIRVPIESGTYRREGGSERVFRTPFVPSESPAYRGRPGVGRPGANGEFAQVPLAAFIDALRSFRAEKAGYVIAPGFFRSAPELIRDVEIPDYGAARLSARAFFMGGQGMFTQLHCDHAHNLHAVVVGRKRWQLYSPARGRELQPVQLHWSWRLSNLDVPPAGGAPDDLPGGVAPDLDFVLEAGQILFCPYGWWHRVSTLADAIATNYWWLSSPMLLRHGPRLAASILKWRLQRI